MLRHVSSRRSVAAVATLAAAAMLSACSDPVSTSGGGSTTSDSPPDIQSVVTGAHTCALTTTGAAYCWGYNANGQLGNNTTGTITATPVRTVGGIVFAALSVSKVEDVTCGLSTTGAAYCWGQNDKGQLGDGTTTRRLVPTPVAGRLQFRSLAVGTGHSCAVAASGTAYCWGSSPNGAFGDGSTGTRLTPMVSAPGLAFESIVTGGDYTCALTQAGAAYCWGVGSSVSSATASWR